jgi:stearoyl-CoA desaturase (delta-9 desaturase)
MDRSESATASQAGKGIAHYFNLIGIAAMHFGAGLAIYMGARKLDVALAVGFYVVRMFVVTGGYHRYFSHRTFKTGRVFQFLLALVGTMTVQKGPLWWAAIHRRHHRESDKPTDVHLPVQRGFWYSHIGWVLTSEHEAYSPSEVKDLYKYPELRWLDKWHVVPVLTYLGLTVAIGGLRGLCWWFCVSTVALMHGTFTINSLSHVWGKRRFSTSDDSRNNWVLAIVTLGEGWHNNHHRHMHSTNQGFYWWEVDITYYTLKVLSWFGVVWDLKKPPQRILDEGRQGNPAPFRKVVSDSVAAASAKLDEVKAKVQDSVKDAVSMPEPADAE